MRFPCCGKDRDKVIDSVASEAGRVIRRRRQCLECDKRFTTYERVEENVRLTVIKRDGTRVPFDRAKVLAGLQKACYKRPVSAQMLQRVVEEVEEELFRRGEREVPAELIGQVVSHRLKQVDQVAYVRFASVYKQFRDLDDFLDEVRDVLENPPAPTDQGKLF